MDNSKSTYLILLDIRSAENVGALFRTADALGVTKIFLIGTTPAPVDRFGRSRGDIAKSALGAEKTIPYEYQKTIAPVLKKLKSDKTQVIAIEQSPDSTDYKKVTAKRPVAFILGNEVSGIPESVLKKCDAIAEIPMHGQKESLNVSVSAGVALFRILGV